MKNDDLNFFFDFHFLKKRNLIFKKIMKIYINNL